jgi:hypothetical protein
VRRNETNLEHGKAVNDLGKSKIGDLDIWWVVFRQKDVLHGNELPFLVRRGRESSARYLRLEVTMRDALGVDVLRGHG